jgi:hypothetical protein
MTPYRSINSASSLHRRMLCPGSAMAEEGLPEVEANNFFAAKGTMLHAVEAADPEMGDMTDGLKLLEQRAIAKNKRLSDEFAAKVFAHLKIEQPGDCLTYRERDFYLCDERNEPEAPLVVGHADEIRWYPDHKITFVFDSKFGSYPVTPADSNLQLGMYTVCAHDDIGGERFYAAIRQPFLKSPLDFHHVEYTEADIADVRAKILEIIRDTQKPNASRNPSVDACWFCRAKGTPRCPESALFIEDVKRAKILTMRPAELEKIGDSVRVSETIIAAWYLRMRMVLKTYPQLIKEWELGPEIQLHDIPHAATAREAIFGAKLLGEDLQIADHLFLQACAVSIPKLRELVAKHQGIPETQAAEAVFALGVHTSKPKERSVRRKKPCQ